jgi:LAS superfamily LD-carboxypeptidase LdcB
MSGPAPRAPVPAARSAARVAVLRRECACSGVQRQCASCARKDTLRRASETDIGLGLAPEIVHEVLGSPGRPLDPATRAFMEPRFGHDFSRVRVHVDGRADESARAVNARAYTVGHDIVFADSAFAPHTAAGRRLLAHELAHVVGDDAGGAGVRTSLAVGSAADAAERAADQTAERVLSSARPDTLPPCPRTTGEVPVLRRQVRNTVVTDFQKRAQACVVHVHGEERTALAVGKEIRGRRCVNFMHLDTTKRHIDFDFKASGFDFEGQADPNRIFTVAGRKGPEAILETHPKPGQKGADKVDRKVVRTAAEAVLQEFADQVFLPRFQECRKNDVAPDAPLPVMALHNNEGLTPDQRVASETRSPNPATGDPSNPSDFILVTRASDFDALKDKHNVILQENPVQPTNDDGSLSVVMAGSRYVNVEKEGRRHDKPVGTVKGLQTRDAVYVKDYAMAGAVLDRFGVSKFPCVGAGEHEQRTRSLFNRRLGQSGRTTTLSATDRPMLEREALPESPPRGCRLFKDQPALDRAADEWRGRIENIPVLNVVHWALGGTEFTPPEPLAEFKAQQKCLVAAMRASLARQGLVMPKGDVVLSEQRSFARQKDIWSKKFAFTFPTEFDRISDQARKQCPALGTDVKWNPRNETHRACWAKLSDDDKQKEILIASAAPGVSRHHAGVDFDVGRSDADLDPKAWTGTGAFADAYRWLARNASAFGFIQPFDTKGGYGTGYMSERWHWSYFPVAQAVLEFVMDHEPEVERALQELWSDGKGGIKPEFSLIAKDWRKYLFNVEQEAVF